MKIQRCKVFLTFIAVSGAGFLILNFIATFFNTAETFRREGHCLDDSHITFNKSGLIDTFSQWRKRDRVTYVFTAYLDDRDPCSAVITVMGFGEKSESLLWYFGASQWCKGTPWKV